MNYFFRRALSAELEREIQAQMDRFAATGLKLGHINGHLNLHLHPVVLRILLRHRPAWAGAGLRCTHDPFWLSCHLGSGRWFYRCSHALAFGALSRWARPKLRREGIVHTTAVFGLLETAKVNEAYLLRLLASLPAGDSELYSHPCLEKFKHEFDALVSPRVRAMVANQGIKLVRYQDL
jgi:hypothetical protein